MKHFTGLDGHDLLKVGSNIDVTWASRLLHKWFEDFAERGKLDQAFHGVVGIISLEAE